MKIRLLTGRAGLNFAQSPGEIIEVDNAEAKRLMESGQGEPVVEKRETATKKKREKRKA